MELLFKLLVQSVAIAGVLISWRMHRLNVMRQSKERMQALTSMVEQGEWRYAGDFMLQARVQEAFHVTLDADWIRLILQQKNPLALLGNVARVPGLLKLNADATDFVARHAIFKSFRFWENVLTLLGIVTVFLVSILGLMESDRGQAYFWTGTAIGLVYFIIFVVLSGKAGIAASVVDHFKKHGKADFRLTYNEF